MNYCKKCNQPFDPKKVDTNHGLCPQCYYEYLLYKIDHLGENIPDPYSDPDDEWFIKILWQKIKQFFHKEK